MRPALVIGYGNELRGDDAAGLRVAELVQAWNDPGVCALTVHQLSPELAEAVAGARVTVFVDAAVDAAGGAVEVRPLAPEHGTAPLRHYCTPAAVLALAQQLFGQCPPAWLVAIPAEQFELGQALSPRAQQGVQRAIVEVRRLCAG